MEIFTFDDASKMTSEALFEQGWNFRVMPHGGRREGAGATARFRQRPNGRDLQRLAAAQDLAIDRRNARKFVPLGIHLGLRYRQISARLTTTDVWQASQASHQESLPPNTL